MSTIQELERAVQTEQDALFSAVVTSNRVSIAMYTNSLRRAEEALTRARIEQGES